MDVHTLDTHKKILGIVYIISAAFDLLIALFIRAAMAMIFDFAFDDADEEGRRVGEFVLSLISIVPILIIVFLAAPAIIAGIGLLSKTTWGPIFSMIVGCFNLIFFPIGTIIGIYSIWIFAEDQRIKRLQNAQ